MSGELRMLDSIYAANLPYGADAYLGYPDGSWPDWAAIVAKFPGKHVLSLTVYPGVAADGCDCENGDLTIGQAAAFAQWRLDAGAYRPVIYCGAANSQPVLAALRGLGIGRAKIRLLSAHYGAGRHICGPGTCGYPQADGTQWRDNAPGLNGSLIDESLLLPWFFDGPPKPKPAPVAALLSGDDVIPLPTKAGAELMIPVPAAVLTLGGPAAPKVLRLSAPGAVAFEYEDGATSGNWLPFTTDAARSPALLELASALHGQAAVKLRCVSSPVQALADFA